MWKIQNEKNTTKFEKQTLRFEIKKKKKISIFQKLLHNKRKIISLNLHLQTIQFQTDQSPGIVQAWKELEMKRINQEHLYQRHLCLRFDVCPLPQLLLLLEDYVLYSFQPPRLDRSPPLHFDTMVSGSRDGSRGPRVSEMLD